MCIFILFCWAWKFQHFFCIGFNCWAKPSSLMGKSFILHFLFWLYLVQICHCWNIWLLLFCWILQARLSVSLKWLLSAAFGRDIPVELRDPLPLKDVSWTINLSLLKVYITAQELLVIISQEFGALLVNESLI